MLESCIEKTINNHATKKGFLYYKLKSTERGMPDDFYISPHGKIFFIEYKQKNKKLQPKQEHIHKELTDRNCNVFVVDEIKKGLDIINAFSEQPSSLSKIRSRVYQD